MPFAFRLTEWISEALIYFMVVFAPWAFGTTEAWTIWTLNIAGFLLGAVLIARRVIRWVTGYRPLRWGESIEGDVLSHGRLGAANLLNVALAALTVLILGYCLVAALNARAAFHYPEMRFEYFDQYIPWLPHSYASEATWKVFWQYLALACFFWGVRDWLLVKTRSERRRGRDIGEELIEGAGGDDPAVVAEARSLRAPALPAKLQRLLWVFCVSGAVLAVEGTLQRLDGTGKLLWIKQPPFNRSAASQFASYAYRSNAATFFNLVWPVCVGFWLVQRKAAVRAQRHGQRIGTGSYLVLLPCAVAMAAAPIISTSRGGALIMMVMMIIGTGLVFLASRHEHPGVRAGMLSIFVVILVFAGYLGWKELARRMENVFIDEMSRRTEIYENSYPIAEEFPVLGTGPGTFPYVYRLYKEPKQTWAGYVHDDYLETRITFGWVGFSLIMGALGLALVRWFAKGGIPVGWEFAAFVGLAMSGCLAHAKYDFPFQVYSLQMTFLLLCAILFCLSRKP